MSIYVSDTVMWTIDFNVQSKYIIRMMDISYHYQIIDVAV